MKLTNLLVRFQGDRSEVLAAEQLGVAASTLSNWKDGLSLPPRTRFRFIAPILGITIEALTEIIESDRQRRLAIARNLIDQVTNAPVTARQDGTATDAGAEVHDDQHAAQDVA